MSNPGGGRLARGGGDHLRQGDLEETSGIGQETMRVADAAAAIARPRQMRVDDLRKEARWPARMRPGAAGVDLLHLLPDPLAVLEHRHLESRDALPRDLDDVLRVVQKGDVVVVATDEQDLAVEIQEALERRPAPERVVPWLLGDEVLGVAAPHHETGDMVVHE